MSVVNLKKRHVHNKWEENLKGNTYIKRRSNAGWKEPPRKLKRRKEKEGQEV